MNLADTALMHPAALPVLALAKGDPGNWAQDFVPFTLFHLITSLACVAVMVAASIMGLMWRGTPRERRFRTGWAIFVLLYQIFVTIFWFLPGNFTWTRSLPLMLCDLAAFLAALAMFRPSRPLLTILYFWGIGLSTQAFVTPVLLQGYGHGAYWRFWIGHIAIVGSAIYAVVVLRYRPTRQDLGLAIGVTIVYAIVVTIVNQVMDRLQFLPPGTFANYGYIGNSTPTNPTVLDKLGPWPQRVFIVAAIVISGYTLLWAIWLVPGLSRRTPARAT